jgi:hypothetical protein
MFSRYFDTVGAVFRVAAIIRVVAVFGALKIIFLIYYFCMVISRFERIRIKRKKFENVFFMPFFLLKVKTAVFLKSAVAVAVIDLEQ